MDNPSLATGRIPAITLTTDFGLADHFVGVMKGVILRICPQARVIDVSHEVKPFEIAGGAFLLAEAWRFFPEGTIHVAVVDPGVGTARRPILVEAGGHFFLGPDNGVLAMVYSGLDHIARHVTAREFFLEPLSRTFHGRDLFAPVAAHLASGVDPGRIGPVIEDHLKVAFDKPQQISKRTWTGMVLHIDRFGNLITNFARKDFGDLELRPFEFTIGTRSLHRVALNYADADAGELFLILGSSGYLEVALNQASAARLLGCGVGAPCELTLQ